MRLHSANMLQSDSRLRCHHSFFFFNDTATTEIYTLSLHDALPISLFADGDWHDAAVYRREALKPGQAVRGPALVIRSEEHTSELQSRQYLVCRLLLEKKKQYTDRHALSVRLHHIHQLLSPSHSILV